MTSIADELLYDGLSDETKDVVVRLIEAGYIAAPEPEECNGDCRKALAAEERVHELETDLEALYDDDALVQAYALGQTNIVRATDSEIRARLTDAGIL